MSQDIYQDKYKATVPKIIDYGCIFISVFSLLFFAILRVRFWWCSLILLCVPFILSRFSGKIYCDDDTIIIEDLYHGKNIIPIKNIQGIDIKVFAHKEGTFGIMAVHHYIFEMKIITDTKKYKFKMNANKSLVEDEYKINKKYEKVAFVKLKRYIEARCFINNL